MDHLTRLLLPALQAQGDINPPVLPPVAQGHSLVVSLDTLVKGVHFPAGTRPRDLGHKALAVNLSDLAAMGAEPLWAILTVALPEDSPEWAAEFAAGFLSLAERFGVRPGGLRTTTGPLNVAVQVLGSVPRGQALRRTGARVGDRIYVTGSLGDAGAALRCLLGDIHLRDAVRTGLELRLNRPEPRLREAIRLRGLATSAIDVSDGLAADLGHILEASRVGASIEAKRLPVSAALTEALGREAAWRAALTSGDDYELCFTVPPECEAQLERSWKAPDCAATPIGRIEATPGLRCHRPDGSLLPVGAGYQHFA